MQWNILYRPSHTLAQVWIQPGEAVVAESGAMVGMSGSVQIQTAAGGIMKGLKRLFGGESFFRNTYTSAGGTGEVLLAHALNGDMAVLDMTPAGFFVQSGAFVASSANVDIDTKAGGFRGFFSGAGVFVLKATAPSAGQLLVGAFGGIQELVCNGSIVVDTGHVVAWDGTLDYKIGKAARGWVSTFLSGEGLVCRFSGQGRVWIQSRNAVGYGRTVGRLLPAREE